MCDDEQVVPCHPSYHPMQMFDSAIQSGMNFDLGELLRSQHPPIELVPLTLNSLHNAFSLISNRTYFSWDNNSVTRYSVLADCIAYVGERC